MLALFLKDFVSKHRELSLRGGLTIRHRVLIEKLIASAAASHEVEDVPDPALARSVPRCRLWDDMVDRDIKPGLVALKQVAVAVGAVPTALVEYLATLAMAGGSVTALGGPSGTAPLYL